MWVRDNYTCFGIPNVYITGVPEVGKKTVTYIKLKEDNQQFQEAQ